MKSTTEVQDDAKPPPPSAKPSLYIYEVYDRRAGRCKTAGFKAAGFIIHYFRVRQGDAQKVIPSPPASA